MARVRFAPSPTGFLHLGGLRTAFVNFLYARKTGGQFIVRIEDTDQERIVPGSYEDIRDSLDWLGLHVNEAPWLPGQYDTYVQSRRVKLYRDSVEQLLSSGNAYRCFCTERRLEILRKEALRSGRVPRYDGRCRTLPSDEIKALLTNKQAFTVRFTLRPSENEDSQARLSSTIVRFTDLIHGDLEFDAAAGESDPILLKSDGFPVYHLANVVDDHAMRITTVLRGAEWLVSTPKHLRLYEAFGWRPPEFGHLPLLLTTDRRKLSKRDDAMRVSELRRTGFEPLAILNALARTCAIVSPDDDETILSSTELVDRFDLSQLRTRSAVLEPARIAKLNATLVQRSIRDAGSGESARRALMDRVRSVLRDASASNNRTEPSTLGLSDEYLLTMLTRLAHRVTRFTQLASPDFRYLFTHPTAESLFAEQSLTALAKLVGPDCDSARLVTITNSICEQLLKHFQTQACAARLEQCIAQNDHKSVSSLLRAFYSNMQLAEVGSKPSFASTMQLIRYAMTGLRDGPGVGEMLCTLGYATACARLENAIRLFRAGDLRRNTPLVEGHADGVSV